MFGVGSEVGQRISHVCVANQRLGEVVKSRKFPKLVPKANIRKEKKQPKEKFFGQGIPGSWDVRDPHVGIARANALCKWPSSVVLDREWPGCPGIWVGASLDQKNFMQGELWADFSLPRLGCKKGKDPHPQDKIQHLDFTKDPRPLYYKTPSCVFYHKNVRSKAVFGP